MKRYILNTLMCGILATGSFSCTEKYLDINSNPYEPGSLTADDYALGTAMSGLASAVVSDDVNTAQFTDCLLGGTCGGYFADAKSTWTETISNFNPVDGWTNVFLASDRVLPVLYANLEQVKIVSQNTGDPVPYAIALIIKVAAMSRVADAYGPIPYTQIGVDGKITVPYDSQEKVYDTFFTELDEAITTLTDNKDAALTASADYVYSGNVQQWIKFANSLKLRLAMRISYANPTKAKEMAESAVTQEFGVIESNEDNAAWHYFGAVTNPLYTAVTYNTHDSRVAADIICYMNGYNDNRRSSYFKAAENAWNPNELCGIRRGCLLDAVGTEKLQRYTDINISASDAIQWMNAAEVAFLRAEGAAVFGFNMGGTAKDFYEQGIRLSFEQWGAGGADAYLNDGTSIPTSYTDPAEGLYSYDSNLSDITIKWDEGATTEEKQERIITQKWIANWMLGNEAWADYRRTGYPRLMPVPTDGNKSGGVVDSNRGARRMPYPASQNTDNFENVQYARDNYLNGPDNMGTDVWWACKQQN